MKTPAASTRLDGGCACGAVRYRLAARPLIVHACHCRDCQRLTGSAFVLNAWIEGRFVETLRGAPASYGLAGGSGRPHDVFFCARCGTYVWSRYSGSRDSLFVRVGTLDEPDALAPDVHIYTRTKLEWLELPAGARAFRSFYRIAAVWPAESKERMRRQREAVRRRSARRAPGA
ncbi:MAG TPA: GFA family protein [Burkholderiales bacterium]|nr:GFA family protein [Burkholderiales bacterium]